MGSKSNVHWTDYLKEHRELENRFVERANEIRASERRSKREKLPEVVVNYSDEFSPSKVLIGTSDPSIAEGAGKLVLYGTEWDAVAEAAIAWVISQGFPRLILPNMGQCSGVSDEYLSRWTGELGAASMLFDENSEEWVCFAIYFQTLALSNMYTVGASPSLIFESTFILGGLTTQLDLQHRNKRDALSRKKQLKGFRENNEARATTNAELKRRAREWHAHARSILEGIPKSLSKSRQAELILARWDKGGSVPEFRPAKKTLQHWL